MGGEQSVYEGLRKRVMEIASLLEEKDSIPAIKEQLQYLKAIQDTAFWEDIGLLELEKIRQRLRGLMPFLDKRNRKIVYTDFQDEITGVREAEGSYLPKMTGNQYQKKVEDYLRNHLDHLVIKRLRSNQPLTEVDLQGLEQTLVEIGEDEGSVLLQSLLIRSEAPSLAYFVRKIVGMDRAAVQEAFAQFISDRSLSSQQMRFIEMIIEQLVSNGVVEPKALYEAPYSGLHAGGPEELFLGHENVIDGVFGVLEEIKNKVA
jgi:type I restriction enzyme R subunit